MERNDLFTSLRQQLANELFLPDKTPGVGIGACVEFLMIFLIR